MTEHVCPVGALTAKDFRFKARVWFLRSVRSVCQGCATGCNAYTDYDPRDQTVYRHRPRENQEVNKYWMCDEGVLDYRRVHENRIDSPKIGKKAASLDDAIAEAKALLSSVKGDQLAVLLSFTHSSEDNYAVMELGRALGSEQIFASGRPSGEGDTILRHTDKNSNRAGVLRLAPEAQGLADLASAVESGRVKVVLALGSEAESEAVEALGRAKTVALSTFQGPIAERAQALLPASSWAEASGTFVNAQGLSQVSEKAISPAYGSRPAWKLALSLAAALGKKMPFGKRGEIAKVVRDKVAGAPAKAEEVQG
jgi:NADH-quinone oxidoreductase subunit G